MTRQLSGADASMLWMDRPDRPNHISPIQIYDQSTAPDAKVTLKGILRYLDERLHLARSFRERLVRLPFDLDLPYWVDDESFDLEFHVRHIALPKPGDWRQLCIQLARVHARPLDLSRPPWELYVIEGLNRVPDVPRGAFATMLKVHHAAVDGVSGLEMVTAMHQRSATAAASESPPWDPRGAPPAPVLLSRAALGLVTRPQGLPHFARSYLPVARRGIAGLLPGNTGPRPTGLVTPTRFNGAMSVHRVFEARRFPLEEIKRIKSAVPGATLNDAVLAMVGGTLRRFLIAEDELPETSLVSAVPISIRAEDEKGTGGNRITTMAIPLGTDVADPLERLRSIHETTVHHKAMRQAVDAPSLIEIAEHVPGALLGVGMRAIFGLSGRRSIAHTCVTNVPGPSVPLYFAGARMVATMGLVPLQAGVGLFHAVTTYCDELTVSVTSCREMLPDPAQYAACLEESYTELREAAS